MTEKYNTTMCYPEKSIENTVVKSYDQKRFEISKLKGSFEFMFVCQSRITSGYGIYLPVKLWKIYKSFDICDSLKDIKRSSLMMFNLARLSPCERMGSSLSADLILPCYTPRQITRQWKRGQIGDSEHQTKTKTEKKKGPNNGNSATKNRFIWATWPFTEPNDDVTFYIHVKNLIEVKMLAMLIFCLYLLSRW